VTNNTKYFLHTKICWKFPPPHAYKGTAS